MGKNFTPVQRININNMGDLELIDKVNEIVVKNGTPLILQNLKKNNKWNTKLFTLEHLEKHHGEEEIICRDLTNSVDKNSYNIESAAENLMVYIGRHGTWTPTHFDHCGAIGHNVMLWADKGSSSIWFMIATEDMSRAETLWESFGQNIEFENYFASMQDLAQADFPIHILEQHVGDLILIPSLGYHQVVNLGKATIKAAWNRLTTHCLNAAINVVLPRYKRINNPEVYKIKAIIKGALEAWTKLLEQKVNPLPVSNSHFCKSFKDLITLFLTITQEEWVDFKTLKEEHSTAVSQAFQYPKVLPGNTTPASCDFCRCDIWNRHFHCNACSNKSYDICTACYANGRGCEHRATSSMTFTEHFTMDSLQTLYLSAIKKWNTSSVLASCESYSQITEEWIH
ncbi:hypothetical protein BGX26_002559, partial [Mortierella sp. AD094]